MGLYVYDSRLPEANSVILNWHMGQAIPDSFWDKVQKLETLNYLSVVADGHEGEFLEKSEKILLLCKKDKYGVEVNDPVGVLAILLYLQYNSSRLAYLREFVRKE